MQSQVLKQEVEKVMQEELPHDFFQEVEECSRAKLSLQERLYGPKDDDYLILLAVDMVRQVAFSYYTMAKCFEKTIKMEV